MLDTPCGKLYAINFLRLWYRKVSTVKFLLGNLSASGMHYFAVNALASKNGLMLAGDRAMLANNGWIKI